MIGAIQQSLLNSPVIRLLEVLSYPRLCPRLPRVEVLVLFWRKRVNLYTHRLELETRNLFIDCSRYSVDARLQLFGMGEHILGPERLIGKAHVHDAGRVSLRS